MNIYILRHGTTVWNETGRIQGRRNNRLSKQGKLLVEQTALENKDKKFDIIYASPIMRTMQTANIFNKYHNLKIVKEPELLEIDEGDFTGKFKKNLSAKELKLLTDRDKKCKMESWYDAFLRVEKYVKYLKQNCKYNDVVLVTHDFIATCLEYALKGQHETFENYVYFKNFKNAELRKYVI